MTTKKRKPSRVWLTANLCLAAAALFITSLYVIGCIQQARGKYRHERDTRDHVKGQVQPVPHERNK
ncbi:MAG: hypothetical protein HUU46_15255 [Candidatus Hydrogenedentes bacterium]|nr:hypothetical protein [Candidatus Hydrogenedentota bacterium]